MAAVGVAKQRERVVTAGAPAFRVGPDAPGPSVAAPTHPCGSVLARLRGWSHHTMAVWHQTWLYPSGPGPAKSKPGGPRRRVRWLSGLPG